MRCRVLVLAGLLLLRLPARADVALSWDLAGNLASTVPVGTNQPLSFQQSLSPTTVVSNGTLALSAPINGGGLVTFQWFFNGSPINLATNDSLLLANFTATNGGGYFLVASNSAGAITSAVFNVYFDADQDGMGDSWELTYFGTLARTGLLDFDGDGVSDRDEFREGTDPTNPASVQPRLRITGLGGTVLVDPLKTYYTNGESVTLTAVPDSGKTFQGWFGSVSATTNPLLLVMDATKSILASFATVSLGDALEQPSLTWQSGGDVPWHGQTATNHDGVDAAQCGTITHNQQSWLQTTLTNSSYQTLSFWWRVASYDDSLQFLINGVQYASLSGVSNWVQHFALIPPGTNTTRWAYVKNSSDDQYGSNLVDLAWLDQIQIATLPFTPGPGHGLIVPWGDNSYGQSAFQSGLSNVVGIAAGGYNNLALTSNGKVSGWGDNSSGQTNVPATLSNVVAIAAGQDHSLALKSNGTVTAWGSSVFGQTSVPVGLSNVIAIAGGESHSLALRSNGTIVAWGYGGDGQTTVPANLSNVVAVAAGGSHSLALRNDGKVVAWGGNAYGQATVPANLSNVVAVAGGSRHSLALRSDGTVASWGDGSSGQTNVPAGLSNVVMIAAGNYHNLALRSDGSVVAWGTNSFGQSSPPPTLQDVVAVSAGAAHSLALVNDGSPAITRQPFSQTVFSGTSVTLSVGVAGRGTRNYQWLLNGTNIAGATNALLELGSVQPSNSGIYGLTISNALGSVVSADAVLTVRTSSPSITLQPASRITVAGSSVSFNCEVVGSLPLFYQWQHAGTNLIGATNSMLALARAEAGDAGDYKLIITNAFGTTNSTTATLTLVPSLVVAWGYNGSGQTNVPATVSNVVAIAGGQDHSLALLSSGTVAAWGYNGLGQTSVPAGLSNVIAIAGGGSHSLALRTNGTVVAWGYGGDGQTTVPAGLSNVLAIAAGGSHSLALRNDGKVFAWGYNLYGQATVPASLSNVVAVAAGSRHSLALRSDGTVASWGDNALGQTSVPSGLSNVVAIAAGGSHNLALKSDGTVAAWGYNNYGQTVVPSNLSNVIAVTAGSSHSLALKDDGTLVGWGYNIDGQTTSLPALPIVAISAGGYHNLAIGHDHSPFVTRQPARQSLFSGADLLLSVGVTMPGQLSYQWQFSGTTITGATDASLKVTNVQAANAGAYLVVVSNSYGAVTSSVVTVGVTLSPPIIVQQPSDQETVGLASARFEVSAVGSLPLSYQWQHNDTDIPGATAAALTLATVGQSDFGSYRALITNNYGAIFSDSATLTVVPSLVIAWGYGGDGQTTVPPSLTNAVAIAAGDSHSVALRADGSVIAWGDNFQGQTDVPPTLSNVVAVAAGGFHNLALQNNGSVVSWGQNDFGQTNVPTTLSNVIAIAAGAFHSLALKRDGTIIAWGDDDYGQTDLPLLLSNVVSIAAGYYHNLALKADGTVTAWGGDPLDDRGQTDVPADLSNVVAVAAGYFHNLALRGDGTVAAWGDNDDGEANVPPGLSNVVTMASGGYHNLGLGGDGTILSWGFDDQGQTKVPVGLPNVVAIAGGGYHSLALLNDGSPYFVRQPFSQVASAGAAVSFDVTLMGLAPFAYQWQFNGVNITSATSSVLVLAPVQLTNAGSYSLVISNVIGSVTSLPAWLSVLPPPPTEMQIHASIQSGLLVASFYSIPGRTYTIEYATTLSSGWAVLTNLTAMTTNVLFSDSIAISTQRYYRASRTGN